jgi:hypothetical protein
MATTDSSTKKRPGLWLAAVVIVVLVAAAFLMAPVVGNRSTGDTGQKLAIAGVVEAGPAPSRGLAHPGSMTQGVAGTDSRDNCTPNAGRPAPSPDTPPTSAPAGPATASADPS